MTNNIIKNLSFLLIDDDKLDRMNTIRTLKRSNWSFTVCEASTAEEGLKLASNGSFDLILLDYQLPKINGLELLRMIKRSSSAEGAVVMLSHSDDITLSVECIESGAQDYITKSEMTVSRLCKAIIHSRERNRIQKELRDSHEKLKYLSERDPLTGLANRFMFDTALKSTMALTTRHQRTLALILLDLDKFKEVNDTLGHDIGDELLVEFSNRLNQIMRDGDIACRLGGDEFTILVQDLPDASYTRRLSDRILEYLDEPFVLSGHKLTISASIGIATFPENAKDSAQLLKCADVAMYRAKSSGRNRSHFYSKATHREVMQKSALEHALKKVVQNNQLFLDYQPQIDPQTGDLSCVEALLNWKHPDNGVVVPNIFIPIAEDIGMINEISVSFFQAACQQLSVWKKQYGERARNLPLAIKLSPIALSHEDVIKKIKTILIEYEIPAKNIGIELSESVLNECETANQLLHRLSSFGFGLILDDFGAEYTSLIQFRSYPINAVRINQEFIGSENDSDSHVRLMNAINSFAKSMNYEIIVKGVDTKHQYEACQKLSFDRLQGSYISQALLANDFEDAWFC